MKQSIQDKLQQSAVLLLVVAALSAQPALAQFRSGLPTPRVLQRNPIALQAGSPGQPLPKSGTPQALIDPGPIGLATTTALFAHLALGGGYTTTFTFVNTGTQLDGSLILTGQDGKPLNANLSSGSIQTTGSTIPLSIKPGGTQFVVAAPATANDPSVKAGWARVENSGGTLSGVGTFQVVSGGVLQTIAGVLASDVVTAATIPVDDDVSARRFTGYAVANPSATDSITIKVQTVNLDGTPAATLTSIPLGPGEQTATFVFQDKASSPKFKGSVVLIGQAGKSFAVVALVQAPGSTGDLFTAIPVIPGKAAGIN
jgi:hypothetical protein